MAYLYDAAGNVTQENGSRHYQWDAADQLRQFATWTGAGTAPTLLAYYLYASGQRVKKLTQTSADTWQVTVYADGGFEHRYEVSQGTRTGEQTQVAVLDGPHRLYQRRSGDALGDQRPDNLYTLDDHLGSAAAHTDASGQLVSREEYYPFGETSFGSSQKQRYRYCGKELDEESGLYYYGARYYAAWLCRFVSVDPLAGDYPYLNPYNYAGNMPITHIDIDGLQGTGNTPAPAGAAPAVSTPSPTVRPPAPTLHGTRSPSQKFDWRNEPRSPKPPTTIEPKPPIDLEPIDFIPGIGGTALMILALVLLPLPTASDDTLKQYPQVLAPQNLSQKERRKAAQPVLDSLAITGRIVQDPATIARQSTTEPHADDPNWKWVTYTRRSLTNPKLVYSGHASGPANWTIQQILNTRYGADPKESTFAPAKLDKSATGPAGYLAIRGREQQLIDKWGGAQRDTYNFPGGGTSANIRREVSRDNKFGLVFHHASNIRFAEELYRYTGK